MLRQELSFGRRHRAYLFVPSPWPHKPDTGRFTEADILGCLYKRARLGLTKTGRVNGTLLFSHVF